MTEFILTPSDEESVVQAIRSAEKRTSGEIRVHIEAKCAGNNPIKRAEVLFHELGMDATAEQNGVLIYLAHKDHQFAILGDRGINEIVPDDFWTQTAHIMAGHFKEGHFVEGLIHGISHAGEQLRRHFPYTQDDENELDDAISKG